jgi:hypothetical protein
LFVAFKFLQGEVHLENISAEDVVDKNTKTEIIMALLWALVLRYQISMLDSGGLAGQLSLLSCDIESFSLVTLNALLTLYC